MQKLFRMVHRLVLVMGFLASLAPCYACQQEPTPMKSCPMCDMGHSMSCCHHSKSMDRLCNFNDRTTVVPSSVHPPVVAASVAAAKVFWPPFLRLAKVAQVVQVVESPPRSSPVLRI